MLLLFYKMIKSYFFLSMLTAAHAFSDCQPEQHGDRMCNFMSTHNRQYLGAEFKLRKARVDNVRDTIHDGVQFGLTSRSDRFEHELGRNMALKLSMHRMYSRDDTVSHVPLARTKRGPIDWRWANGKSFVSNVKDQGDCGGCFAFASATVLEYWSVKEQGYPKSLSAQLLMDCTSGSRKPDAGCDGGLMEYVFEYGKHHAVALDVDLPYREYVTSCPHRMMLSHVMVEKYGVLMHEDDHMAESHIPSLLHAYGPVSVGIDSSTMDNYRGGIFKSSMCSKNIDHAVAIVGYTKDAWIIKNSWGTSWGDRGYLHLERGKNACGVAEYIVYVKQAKRILKQMSPEWSYSI